MIHPFNLLWLSCTQSYTQDKQNNQKMMLSLARQD